MAYKGEERKLNELQPGTPVEVVSKEEFQFVGPDEKGHKVGILTGWGPDYYNSRNLIPRLLTFSGEQGKVNSPSKGLPPDMIVFKELTGIAGKRLKQRAAEYAVANIGKLLTKSPGHNVGCDPEIFAVDEKGIVIPAYKWLPAKGGSGPFWDGFQAEFAPMPSYCGCLTVDLIQGQLKRTYQALKKFNPQGRLTMASVLEVPEEELQSADIQHVALGCSPSKNAYGHKGTAVHDGRMLKHRFAGGHVHLGCGHHLDAGAVVRTCDAFLGVCNVGMMAGFENPLRRRFYGLAGEYRLPQHGIEYRTLSNMWLCHPAITMLTFDMAKLCVWLVGQGLQGCWRANQDEVVRVIQESDVDGARKIVADNEELFIQMIEWLYLNSTVDTGGTIKKDPKICAQAAYRAVMSGISDLLRDPMDVEGNWLLAKGNVDRRADNGARVYDSKDAWVEHNESYGRQWYKAADYVMKGERV